MAGVQVTQKRSACDRCRVQKLRCQRDETHPDEFCVRCIRSDVECITTSSKRPGRPTKHPAKVSQGSREMRSIMVGEVGTSMDLGNIANTAAVDDCFTFDPLDIEYDMLSAYLSSAGSHGLISGNFASGDGGCVTIPTIFPTPMTMDTTSPKGHAETSVHGSPSDFGSQSDHDLGENGLLPPLSTRSDEPGLQISALHHDLTQQISMLRSVPWDTTEVLRLTSIDDPSFEPASHFASKNAPLNPLASISRSSIEFAKLLRTFQVGSAANGNETQHTGTNTRSPLSAAPRLSMSELLTTISCYILIVSIYDTIFSRCIAPSSRKSETQSGPKLFLGGIEVPMTPNMLNHLLFRILDSQLRPIEELLDLPSEFCVSWKRDASNSEKETGLFSGRRGQSLLTALIQMEMERASDGGGGLKVIESLKDNVRRVQHFDSV